MEKKLTKRSIVLSRMKRRFLKHLWLARLSFLAAILLGFYLLVLMTGFILKRSTFNQFFEAISSFIFTPNERIESIEGRTNILLLGKPGEGNVGPDLTDTIIFVSFSHKSQQMVFISLPRDIWIPELRAKLNSAYYWGNEKQENGGLVLVKAMVEEIIGRPVHYGIVLDFSGFIKIIDALAGIEIEVEQSFRDEEYPIAGRENDDCGGDPEFLCRYETIEFKKGNQFMDGSRALKFVRSRNAEGDEGTDLARAVRQEKVLSAVIRKILSAKILFSSKTLMSIWKITKTSVETDVPVSAGAILARRVLQARENRKSLVLSEDFLVNPPISPRYDNQYVFIPKNEDLAPGETSWSRIHRWVETILP